MLFPVSLCLAAPSFLCCVGVSRGSRAERERERGCLRFAAGGRSGEICVTVWWCAYCQITATFSQIIYCIVWIFICVCHNACLQNRAGFSGCLCLWDFFGSYNKRLIFILLFVHTGSTIQYGQNNGTKSSFLLSIVMSWPLKHFNSACKWQKRTWQ